MDVRTWFILSFTFFVGVCSGAYLYVTSFAPAYVSDDFEDVATIAFKLQGEQYGGCLRGGSCRSFTLTDDRRYELEIMQGRETGNIEIIKGRLSRTVYEELYATAQNAPWDQLTQRVSNPVCDAHVDGIDYRYLLTFDGEQIPLDTCGMRFDNSEVSVRYQELWQEFLDPQQEDYFKEGLDGAMRQQIDDWFQYDD